MSVALPLSRRGVLTAAVLTFAHTFGEFGVVLMIGGNIPGQTETASIALFNHAEALDYGAAYRLSLLLLVLCFALLLIVYGANRRIALQQPGAMSLSLRVALARRGFTLDVRTEVPSQGITGVFGRSGSGKTTLLRCIAGLERDARGHIALNGSVWQDDATVRAAAPACHRLCVPGIEPVSAPRRARQSRIWPAPRGPGAQADGPCERLPACSS